ncbi:MAG: ABC transporter ATP-binding protein [Acutalibacteraceae bacterium]|nr:ABC transporter ATP-binding protein [Acutalibacteraceae bacterium]HIR02459.1 ABC transporter ATP-binding protein [Candidatus Scatovicinus merdipullorum]
MALLVAENLSVSFGGLKAVDRFHLKIEKGQLYGLIGPNGAGKSTVFNLLTGVYKPETGVFYLDHEKLSGKSTAEISRKGIARTFQNIRLFSNLSVLDNVKAAMNGKNPYSVFSAALRLPAYWHGEERTQRLALELLEVFALEASAHDLAQNLPYGQQRKLEIARALATEPKLLLLDEPAAGMNPNETVELMQTIRLIRDQFHMTILLIEHDMRLVSEICQRLTVLNFGQEIASGETSDVLRDPKVISAYLGQ